MDWVKLRDKPDHVDNRWNLYSLTKSAVCSRDHARLQARQTAVGKDDCDQQFHNISIICQSYATYHVPYMRYAHMYHMIETFYIYIKYIDENDCALFVPDSYCDKGW